MSNPKWPPQPNLPPQPNAPAQGPFGAPSQQGNAAPFAATQAMEFQPGQLPGVVPGAPPQPQAPWGAAPQPSQQGAPFGQPSQPWGQPSQQGAPFGQPSQPWGQPQQPAWGQAPQPQQPVWGAAPQQQPWGAPSGYAAPPPKPAAASGRSALSMLGAGVLVVLGVGAKVALRTGARSISRTVSSASTAPSTLRPLNTLGATRPARAAATPDEQLQDKIDPYVQHCLNRFSRQVFDAEGRYFDWVDRRKGPTGRERVVYGIYDVTGDPAECTRAVSTASAATPSVPALEAAGPRFSTALAAVVPLIRQAHAYYANPMTYRGDHMAQGALLHPQLVTAFENFTAAQRALSDAVSESQDRATDAFLARVRNDPSQAVEYHLKNDQRMARHLARALRGWDIDRRGALTGLDAATFAPAVDEYRAGVTALSTATLQNPRQATAIGGLSLYQARSATYLTQLQALSSRLQTGERFSRGDLRLMHLRMGWTVQGSPDAVNRAYNELVQSYNALR